MPLDDKPLDTKSVTKIRRILKKIIMVIIKLRLNRDPWWKFTYHPHLRWNILWLWVGTVPREDVIINISEFIAPLIWRRGSNDQFNAYEVQIHCHTVKRDIIIPNFSIRKNINGVRTCGRRFPLGLFSQSYINFIFSRIP